MELSIRLSCLENVNGAREQICVNKGDWKELQRKTVYKNKYWSEHMNKFPNVPLIISFYNSFVVRQGFWIYWRNICSKRKLAWLWEKTDIGEEKCKGILTIRSRSKHCISSTASLNNLRCLARSQSIKNTAGGNCSGSRLVAAAIHENIPFLYLSAQVKIKPWLFLCQRGVLICQWNMEIVSPEHQVSNYSYTE